MARALPALICILVRIAIGTAFIVAGALKAWDPLVFQRAVDGFHVLPFALTAVVALYLPWLEILSGALVVLGGWSWRAGLAVLSGLAVVFLAVLALAWARGLNPDCGCFGAGAGTVGEALLRDVAILVGLALVWTQTSAWPNVFRRQSPVRRLNLPGVPT